MRTIFIHTYQDIISIENVLHAWQSFKNGKNNKKDVQILERNLMEHVFDLHTKLQNNTYRHSHYMHFKINDPKQRDIHKACVEDRIVHHLLYNFLYPFFDAKFICDSYSCRINKGTHKAIQRFEVFHRKVSKNNTKTCWVLKCDIRKFFASIDHKILKEILHKHIQDKEVLLLLENIIDSFPKGLPLGNLTSQLLVNVYMNEFDQHMKHKRKVKYYIRYADDFVILSNEKNYLQNLIQEVAIFLKEKLRLELHPNKVFIKTIYSGVDFLGWIHFPKHRVLRTATKKRMFRILTKNDYKEESISSYKGMLSHGNAKKLMREISI